MKKVLFSAIAMIAFAGSAFASNEIVLENEIQDNKVEKIIKQIFITIHV